MYRRTFITRTTKAFALFAGGVTTAHSLVGCGATELETPGDLPAALAANLGHLADSHYSDLAVAYDTDELYQALLAKEVVSETGEYYPEKVAQLAKGDRHTVYNGFYHTDTELELYSLAYLLNFS